MDFCKPNYDLKQELFEPPVEIVQRLFLMMGKNGNVSIVLAHGMPF
jgi:hypothetical protein